MMAALEYFTSLYSKSSVAVSFFESGFSVWNTQYQDTQKSMEAEPINPFMRTPQVCKDRVVLSLMVTPVYSSLLTAETYGAEPWRMWVCSDLVDCSLGIRI